MLDLTAGAVLADWFEFTTEALEHLRADADPDDDVTIVRIWPEHFDAAIDMGDGDAGRRATYGGSPGDRNHGEPYLYAYYTQPEPYVSTLSRFTVRDGKLDMSTEKVLLRVPTEPQCCHQAGDLFNVIAASTRLDTGVT